MDDEELLSMAKINSNLENVGPNEAKMAFGSRRTKKSYTRAKIAFSDERAMKNLEKEEKKK